MAVAERTVEAPVEPRTETGPFKFLDFFTDTPEDRRRFGGREREIRELVARIANEWTLVLYGRSGIGKTSLLLTGIFPELEARGYRPVYARTLTDPIRDLCRAVGDKCGTGVPEEDLRTAVEQAVAGGPLVIVLDQFEEFFIRFRDRPEVRSTFIEAIGSLVNDRSLDVTVVFSLREDWLASLDDFREKIPDLFQNQYRLRPLTAFGVRQAISRPLTDAGISYDDAVISKLVDQLEDSGFDPPVLQIICSELYRAAVERAKGDVPRITLDDVHKVGDLDDIFRRCLDGLAQAIPEDKTLLARMILDALITGDDTKQAVTVENLLKAQFSAQEGEIREILDILVRQKLLRRQLRDGEPWYELIHERLVPHLKRWLDSDPRFYEFRQARDFVVTSGKTDLWSHKPEALLNAGVLTDLLGPYKERFHFQAREWELIFRSALYRHNPDVAFWAERLGLEKATEITLSVASSSNELQRNGAAIAASNLSDPEGVLAAVCLRLALADPAEAVRSNAGRSLAQLAGKREILSLYSALRRKETRRAARQTLTDLRLGGHPLKEFSRLSRRFAREGAERRLQIEHREIIRARRKSGAMQGMIASLVWIFVAGIPIVAFGVGLLGVDTDQEWYQRMAATLGVLLPTAAIFGAILGGVTASAVARDAIVTGEDGHWVRALVASRLFFYSIGPLVVLGLSLWILTSDDAVIWQPWIAILLALVVTAPLVPILAGGLGAILLGSRPAIWPPESPPRLWLWSLLSGLGTWGFSISTLALGFYLTSGKDSFETSWTIELGLSFLTGMAVFVSLVAITYSEYKCPVRQLAEPTDLRRHCGSFGAIAGTLLAIVWLGYFLHLEMIPSFAPNKQYDSSKGIELKELLGPRQPDTRYFRLCNSTDSLQFANVLQMSGDAIFRLGLEPNGASTFLLPPGCHLGSFHLKSSSIFPRNQDARLTPIPDLDSREGSWRSGLVVAPLALRFSPTQYRPWVGTIRGVLPKSERGDRIILVSPQWYKLSSAALATQGRIRIFADNYSEDKESGREAELSPPPQHPIWIHLRENYWPIIPDSSGLWQITFRVLGATPRSDIPIGEVTIPTLLSLVYQEDLQHYWFEDEKTRNELELYFFKQKVLRQSSTPSGPPATPPSGRNSVSDR